MPGTGTHDFSHYFQILSIALIVGLITASGQCLHAQNENSQPVQPDSAATPSLGDHPLVGWWMLDAEKTAEEINSVIEDSSMRERILGNFSSFHIHFGESGDCTVLAFRVGEGTWSENAREPQQGEITIRIGNNPTGFKFVLQDSGKASLQPEQQDFRIFFRRLKAPIVDPERLDALTAQLGGTWRVSVEKTKLLHTARKYPRNTEIDAMLPELSWELKGNLLQATTGLGPKLTMSPLVADVDDWQAQDWNGVILGKTNLGTAYSWEFNKGEATLVIDGMPLVVERD